MDREKYCTELFQEFNETERIEEVLDTLLEAEGKTALEENQIYSKIPDYQITPQKELLFNRLFMRVLWRNHQLDKQFDKAFIREKQQIEPHRKLQFRILMIAALLAVFFCAIHTSAIRSFIGNYFLNKTEQSADFSDKVEPGNEYIHSNDIPLPTILPAGFAEENVTTYENFTEIIYQNQAGEKIRYSVYQEFASVRLDSENAVEYDQIQINGQSGVCIVKNNQLNLFWGKQPPCQLQGPIELKEELLQMAENVNQPEMVENKGG